MAFCTQNDILKFDTPFRTLCVGTNISKVLDVSIFSGWPKKSLWWT